jgi:adenylate cyclase
MLYLRFTCLFALLFALPLAAQDEVTNLLARLEATKSDTGKAMILTDLAFEYIGTDNALAHTYALQALAASGVKSDLLVSGVANRHFPKGEAAAYNVLGVVLDDEGKPAEALNYFRKAAAIRQGLGDYLGAGGAFNNMAGAYESLNQPDSALVYAKRALHMAEEAKNPGRIARAQYGLASRMEQQGNYTEAQKFAQNALFHYEQIKDTAGQVRCLTMLGGVMLEGNILVAALEKYQRAMELSARLEDTARYAITIRDYANALSELDSTDAAHQFYEQAKSLQKQLGETEDLAITQYNQAELLKNQERYQEALELIAYAEPVLRESENARYFLLLLETKSDVLYDLGRLDEAERLINEYHDLAVATQDAKFLLKSFKDRSKIAYKRGHFAEAYQLRKVYADSLEAFYTRENSVQFGRVNASLEDERKTADLQKQQIQIAQTEKQLAQDRLVRNSLIASAAILGLLTLFIWYRSTARKRANQALSAKNVEIEAERERADALLSNILPEATAQELKANQSVKPVRYESVSVMFTDFSGFTEIASTLAPEILVHELDQCFRLLDDIVVKHGIEKIKTIGDAYMCASGLPQAAPDHAIRAVLAALEMQQAIIEHMSINASAGRPVFQMRLGIHSGPVVAGVVGSRKFAYDIWGDTVNVAARMESAGAVGKVNISEATWQLVKTAFKCTPRGMIAAKGLGEIEMFFVEEQGGAEVQA